MNGLPVQALNKLRTEAMLSLESGSTTKRCTSLMLMTAPPGGAPLGFSAIAAEKADADNQAVGKIWGTRHACLQPPTPPNFASNHRKPAHTL